MKHDIIEAFPFQDDCIQLWCREKLRFLIISECLDHLLVDKSRKASSRVIIFIIFSYFLLANSRAGCESLDNKTLFLFHHRAFIAAASFCQASVEDISPMALSLDSSMYGETWIVLKHNTFYEVLCSNSKLQKSTLYPVSSYTYIRNNIIPWAWHNRTQNLVLFPIFLRK